MNSIASIIRLIESDAIEQMRQWENNNERRFFTIDEQGHYHEVQPTVSHENNARPCSDSNGTSEQGEKTNA